MHACTYILAPRCVSPFDTRPRIERGGRRVHAEVENPAVRFLSGATRNNSIFGARGALMMSQYLSSAIEPVPRETNAWEILILSRFSTPSSAVFSSRPRTGKIHARWKRARGTRFVSEVKRVSRRHVSRVTRAASTDMFCTRVWTESRTNEQEVVVREGGGSEGVREYKVTYITFPVYGPIRS